MAALLGPRRIDPALDRPAGLQRGFERAAIARGGRNGAKTLEKLVRQGIERLDGDEPLFLFVNIYNAHDPYWSVWTDGHILHIVLAPYQNLAFKRKEGARTIPARPDD